MKHSGKDKDKGKKKKSAHSKDWSEDDKKNNSDGGKNTSEIKRNEKGQLVFKGEVKNVLRYRFMIYSFIHKSFIFSVVAGHPEFTPNMTPKEVLQAGSFGGTYFRPIYSSITSMSHCNQLLGLVIAQWRL